MGIECPEYRDDLFEWDEDKNAERLARSFDFHAASEIFRSDRYVRRWDELHSNDEEPFVATGILGTTFVSVVYTERSGRIRIISAFEAEEIDIAEYLVKYARKE